MRTFLSIEKVREVAKCLVPERLLDFLEGTLQRYANLQATLDLR
jgi:hypothetical protein